ncbi:MAG TPA: enoyl-CoA hydratase/isomerase family protein [Stellaceae bacterium]|nr:enoyl-CoA hydratase/isomerase family protein [Stellaceae bacterium]
MSETLVLVSTDARGVATVTLNRPDSHNAFDETLIATLTETLQKLESDPATRLVVLTGAGPSFSAGGDLKWMQRMAGYGHSENVADAGALGRLMRTLNLLAKPTIARVQGAAFAGGVGLVACCDIAVASEQAIFCVSETRLGLVPSVISPYLVRAIGPRAARRYFLTAERFSALEAKRLGLVHEVTSAQQLDATVDRLAGALLEGGPGAQARAKRLIEEVADRPIEDSLIDLTVRVIAEARASTEAREGLTAYFERRKPSWRR